MTDPEPSAPMLDTAWHDFVMFAWSQDEAHAAFRGATNRPQRARTGSFLDAMIDKAVGVTEDDRYMREFVDWVTVNHWGEEFAPEAWKQKRAQSIRRTEAQP